MIKNFIKEYNEFKQYKAEKQYREASNVLLEKQRLEYFVNYAKEYNVNIKGLSSYQIQLACEKKMDEFHNKLYKRKPK